MKNLFWFDREQMQEKKDFILRPHQDEAALSELSESERADVEGAARNFGKGEILLGTSGPRTASNQFWQAERKFAQVRGFEQSMVVCAARRASALLALKSADEALAIFEAMVRDNVQLPDFPDELPMIYWSPMWIHDEAGRPDAALAAAQAVIRRLAPPQTHTQLNCLVNTYMMQGKILAFRDDFAGGLESINAALSLLETTDAEDMVKLRANCESIKAMLLARI